MHRDLCTRVLCYPFTNCAIFWSFITLPCHLEVRTPYDELGFNKIIHVTFIFKNDIPKA